MLAIQRRNAEIYSGTWAGRPTSGIATGATMYVTDVGLGGSLWRWDGSKWRTVAPVTLTEYYNSAGLVFAPGGAEQLIPAEVLLPANLFVQGAILSFSGKFTLGSAAETRGVRIRLGVASGIAGTNVITHTNASTAPSLDLDRSVEFVSATDTVTGANSASGPNTGAGLVTASGIASSGALYLSPTAIPSASNAITVFALKSSLEV